MFWNCFSSLGDGTLILWGFLQLLLNFPSVSSETHIIILILVKFSCYACFPLDLDNVSNKYIEKVLVPAFYYFIHVLAEIFILFGVKTFDPLKCEGHPPGKYFTIRLKCFCDLNFFIVIMY